ncbi:MAG: outer membrane beta-barrel domain-containing protein [Pseudomonadota bacterium]|nr:outer membrane beta-barrel domain-containing protein [Pseudomonadota bacterium]
MEIRLLLLPLIPLIALWGCVGAWAQTPASTPLYAQSADPASPDLGQIDTDDFAFGLYYGLLSIEDFGSVPVMGARVAYHISEGIFVDLSYAQAEAEKTSYELLSGAAALLTEAQRDYSYYNLSLGYNLLAGEAFVGSTRAYRSAFYLLFGGGNTDFGGGERFTVSLGVGFRLFPTDWLSVEVLARDHLFEHDLLGKNKTTHNLEMVFGFSVLF